MSIRFQGANPHRNRLLRASAGTGKTYQLSNRYLELLFAGERPERILATTFTRKAAGEIRSRILLRLAEAASDPKKRQELATALGRPELTAADCRAQLVQTVRQLHSLRVSTLDAFFMELAGSYSLELGLPPGWTIGETRDDEGLRSDAINDVLNGEELQDLVTLFHLLTKGEAERGVAQLIQGLVNTLYAVFVESPAAAWEKIPQQARLRNEELAAVVERLQACPLPTDKRIKAAVEKDLRLIAEGHWLDMLDGGYAKALLADNDTFYSKPISTEIREIYGALLTHIRGDLVTRLAQQTVATRDLLEHFETAYEQQKQDRRLLRFDDVTRRLAQGSGTRRDGNFFRLNGRIEHLLLDEFQDTSFSQWQVLQPLATAATKNPAGSLFCVGDLKQAIYGWRGGVAGIFKAIENDLSDIHGETLAESYRSSPVIMEVVNRVFTKLQQHSNLGAYEEPLHNWCREFPVHKTAKSDYPGYAAIHVSREVNKETDDPSERHFGYAAELIAALVKDAPGRSVGVLCRRNSVVAQMIYRLRKLGLSASEEGGNPLTDSAPVEAILSLLQLVDHPSDSICSFHVAHTPLGPIVGLSAATQPSQIELLTQRLRQELARRGIGPVCLEWAKQLAAVCNERDRNRLQQLVELAYDYPVSTSLRLTDFVALIRATKVPDPAAVDVRVMTIHQAKGLEFDIVVLPELGIPLCNQSPTIVSHRPSPSQPIDVVCRYVKDQAQKLLPADLQQLFTEHIADDVAGTLCLLYVALTRAAHALFMVIPPSSPTEKNLKKDVSGLLRAALIGGQPLQAETTPFELGDRAWHQHAKPNEELVAEDVSRETSAAKITLQPPRKERSRGWQRVAPSQLEGGKLVEWRTMFGESHGGDFSRGTLFHAWFELIEWLDAGAPTQAELIACGERIAADIGSLVDDLPTLAEQFLRDLKQPLVQSLLHRSCYARQTGGEGLKLVVEREFPFALRQGDELLQGAIDRLVVLEDETGPAAAEIIDFKTDTIPGGDAAALADKVAFYRPQLNAYRRAVAGMFRLKLDCVSARLMFVSSDQCVTVDS